MEVHDIANPGTYVRPSECLIVLCISMNDDPISIWSNLYHANETCASHAQRGAYDSVVVRVSFYRRRQSGEYVAIMPRVVERQLLHILAKVYLL